LIVIGSFPGKPSFGGLGELTAGELEALWPTRRAATPETLDAAAAAWDAFRAPEPTALAERAELGSPQLPFLAPALRRLLEELPAPADGLSGTERRALQAIAADARTPGSIERSQRSDAAASGSSKRRKASRYPHPRRSATDTPSPDFRCD
jgi:hypothetical protein